MHFQHTSPLLIKTLDKLSMIIDKKKLQFETQVELLDQVERTEKLTIIFELVAFNNLNLVALEQLRGINTLMDLLKYYGNIEHNQKILIEAEARIMKCVGISLRNDRIIE